MLVSGFTIARNAIKYNYPILESIQSILPICDEFVVNVGDSDDGTLELIHSLKSPKIRIIENVWDFSMGKEVLSHQTNVALKECRGTWAFYLQSDELIHEADWPRLRGLMEHHADDKNVEAFRFKWMHFYGSYYRYRIDHGWFQKQDRITRNNGQIESEGDAWGFRRKDGRPLKRKNTGCLLYHYGWVHPQDVMADRRRNAEKIGFVQLANEDQRQQCYSYGELDRFPLYFGSHPAVMREKITAHAVSQNDRREIQKKYWWHPFQIWSVRYKTSRRVKTRIE